MYRLAVVAILLLSSLLWAETQEEVYYRAMKAEESGDISLAVKTFEEAVALPGPYTEELKEILKNYYEALGIKGESESSPWSFRFGGDAGFNGLKYNESSLSAEAREYGGDLFLSLTPFLDYSSGDWLHSFGLEATGDWFLMNDNMPALDTSDWTLSLGVDYSLIGTGLILNVGANVNLSEKEDLSLSLFGWFQKEFYRNGKNRFGAALWAYYRNDGPLSSALYATWNRSATHGWNGSVYLGARFEADSVMDYKRYVADYNKQLDKLLDKAVEEASNMMGAYDYCWQNFGSNCLGMSSDEIDSLYWEKLVDDAINSVSAKPKYSYGMWLGPALRSRVFYKFKTNITLEAKVNLFYGFVLNGPDKDYEKIQKFTGTFGGMMYWKPSFCKLYLGLEQIYRYYNLPEYYKDVYPESGVLTQLKAGVKWEI